MGEKLGESAGGGGTFHRYVRPQLFQDSEGEELAVDDRTGDRHVRVGTVLNQEPDKLGLLTGLAGDSAGDDEPESVLGCGTGVEKDFGDLDGVDRQTVVSDGVLGDEVEEGCAAKVAAFFELDDLMYKTRIDFESES